MNEFFNNNYKYFLKIKFKEDPAKKDYLSDVNILKLQIIKYYFFIDL